MQTSSRLGQMRGTARTVTVLSRAVRVIRYPSVLQRFLRYPFYGYHVHVCDHTTTEKLGMSTVPIDVDLQNLSLDSPVKDPLTQGTTTAESVFDSTVNEIVQSAAQDSRAEVLTAPPTRDQKDVKMAVYYHPVCSQHRIPDHPEHHSRVDSILAILRKTWQKEIQFRESTLATDEHILLFHTPDLLKRFHKLADKALAAYRQNKTVAYVPIDSDTTVMWQTRPAAFYAAGSVICALDSMYASENSVNKIDTAFCCVRPPGHHAERDKSGGFCFLNNVAIGARYAQRTHGVDRVAVLDFDVHHGNGTEEGFTDDPSVFYGSSHGKDHYPGTGRDPTPFIGERAKRDVDRRIVNRLLTPGPESRPEFFVKWREILDEMERFQPQLVIMSTGFDAHDDDPLADVELQDEDYYWVTAEILASCGRVVAALGTPVRYLSVLEGGYDIPAIQRSAVCHVRAMLEGIPEAGADTPGPAEVGEGGDQGTQSASWEVGAESRVSAEDGELAALREYLQECGINDA